MEDLLSNSLSFLGIGDEKEEKSEEPQMKRSNSMLGLDLKSIGDGLAMPLYSAAQLLTANDGVSPKEKPAQSERQVLRRVRSDVKMTRSHTFDGEGEMMNMSSSRPQEDSSFIENLLNFLKIDEEEYEEAAIVFGVDSLSSLPLKCDIPNIIYACLEYLYDTEAFLEEGLFRVGGSVANIRQLKEELTFAGDDIVIDEESVPDPHDVTGLIKSFFKELGEPLLTNNLYPEFMTAKRRFKDQHDELIKHVRTLVSRMPPLNRMVLKRIIYFLHFTAQFESINRMGATNLATTLGPTLLAKQEDLSSVATSVTLMVLLINEFSAIFGEYRLLPFEKRAEDVEVNTATPPSPLSESLQVTMVPENVKMSLPPSVSTPEDMLEDYSISIPPTLNILDATPVSTPHGPHTGHQPSSPVLQSSPPPPGSPPPHPSPTALPSPIQPIPTKETRSKSDTTPEMSPPPQKSSRSSSMRQAGPTASTAATKSRPKKPAPSPTDKVRGSSRSGAQPPASRRKLTKPRQAMERDVQAAASSVAYGKDEAKRAVEARRKTRTAVTNPALSPIARTTSAVSARRKSDTPQPRPSPTSHAAKTSTAGPKSPSTAQRPTRAVTSRPALGVSRSTPRRASAGSDITPAAAASSARTTPARDSPGRVSGEGRSPPLSTGRAARPKLNTASLARGGSGVTTTSSRDPTSQRSTRRK